jgi:hypothetical protein
MEQEIYLQIQYCIAELELDESIEEFYKDQSMLEMEKELSIILYCRAVSGAV